ncbi:MAG: DNA polymerase III subunit gamma/tau [Alphaproteobacteria bacterium]|nr:DNA polymerase III subunit gamma/tau [Alphaproteobacteria bacterium]
MSEEKISQATPYRVLARKYRPQNFDELIGQDALVRTLKNAIESGRIAHAFMLTGVRGVGKTTTARIIAKALNYKGPDGQAGPTVGPTDDCSLCRAISEDRHPDVIEMDAASRTGVEDIREILDGVRYAPTEARYKVYVIDEVHMLSKNAFNALLKTLEEPPEHVKFIFATTEIRKVPVTVLSRCQRFDLRRVDVETLSKHFSGICEKEGIEAEASAISLIARAADGSVRDGLSILDQAMALGDKITEGQVEGMLGLADRARSLDLLEHALSGQMPEAMALLEELYKSGADPLAMVQDLLDLVHTLTKLRAVPEAKDNKQAMTEDEVKRAAQMAGMLSMPTLGKSWQILLKGLSEVQMAPNPQAALEMLVLRLAYAADLPDPADLLKRMDEQSGGSPSGGGPSRGGQSGHGALAGGGESVVASSPAGPVMSGRSGGHGGVTAQGGRPALAIVPDLEDEVAPLVQIRTLEDVVMALEQGNEMLLASQVYQFAHLVKLDVLESGGRLDICPDEAAPPKMAPDLGAALSRIMGVRWMVSVVSTPGQPTLAQQARAAEEAELEAIKDMPVMREVLRVFPQAEVIGIERVEEE